MENTRTLKVQITTFKHYNKDEVNQETKVKDLMKSSKHKKK